MYFCSRKKLTKGVLVLEFLSEVFTISVATSATTEERMIHTASSINAWLRCNRYHEFAYRLTYRPTQFSKALEVGTAAHVGINEFWRKGNAACAVAALDEHIKSTEFFASESGEIEAVKVRAYVGGYCHRWAESYNLFDVIAVEHEWEWAADDGLGPVQFAGKMDLILRRKKDGKLIIWDHKTSGVEDAKMFGSPWWSRLVMDTQVTLYREAASFIFDELEGKLPEFWYDVVITSSAKGPKQKKTIRKKKDESELQFSARKLANRESMTEFSRRMREMYRAEEERFIRRNIAIAHLEHDEKMGEILRIARNIEQPSQVLGVEFPRIRNTQACMTRYGTCEFFEVCTGFDSLDSPAFAKKESAHSELSLKGDAA